MRGCVKITDVCTLANVDHRLAVRYSPSSKEMNQGVSLIHPSAFSALTPWPAEQARAGHPHQTRRYSPVSISVYGADVNE